MEKILKYIFIVCLVPMIFVACEQEEVPPTAEVMIDSMVIVPAYVDAEVFCQFRSKVTIQHVKLYLSTESDFSNAEEVSLHQESSNRFSATLKNLSDGENYYVRYKISNIWSDVIMDEIIEFTTLPFSVPIMAETEIMDVTFNSVIVEGKMIRDGGKTVFSRGVVYSAAPSPTLENATEIAITDSSAPFTCFLGGLSKDSVYYARTFAENELGVSYGEEVSFEVDTLWSGYDLGLSVKWGHTNIGAINPEDAGDYFAWGETLPKTEYNWRTYVYCYEDPNYITKYARYVDGKFSLEIEDDAAAVNWGSDWRMPTETEWDELRSDCNWKWTTLNNVNGYRVTGKNGKSIFLPASGMISETNILEIGTHGFYWSMWLDEGQIHKAKSIEFDSYRIGRSIQNRCYGLPIRPVYPKKS